MGTAQPQSSFLDCSETSREALGHGAEHGLVPCPVAGCRAWCAARAPHHLGTRVLPFWNHRDLPLQAAGISPRVQICSHKCMVCMHSTARAHIPSSPGQQRARLPCPGISRHRACCHPGIGCKVLSCFPDCCCSQRIERKKGFMLPASLAALGHCRRVTP